MQLTHEIRVFQKIEVLVPISIRKLACIKTLYLDIESKKKHSPVLEISEQKE